MTCYDCHQSGDTTPAIAVCHNCGAGVCADHAAQNQHTLTVLTATGTQAPLDPHQRRIKWHTCPAAATGRQPQAIDRIFEAPAVIELFTSLERALASPTGNTNDASNTRSTGRHPLVCRPEL